MLGKINRAAVGIDLGGTAVKIGLVDASYDIIAKISIRTNAKDHFRRLLQISEIRQQHC